MEVLNNNDVCIVLCVIDVFDVLDEGTIRHTWRHLGAPASWKDKRTHYTHAQTHTHTHADVDSGSFCNFGGRTASSAIIAVFQGSKLKV